MLFFETNIGTIYCDPRSNNARSILSTLNLTFTSDCEQVDLIWVRKGYTSKYRTMQQHQLLNHIPGERAMTNKGHLTWNLRKYTRKHTIDHFYPETYCLYRTDDRTAFFDHLPPEDHPDNLWILKPTHLSRGEGIRILWQFDELRNQYRNLSHLIPKNDRYIIQRYIKNPLLLNGHKSEIRVYWLIASLSPLLVYLYKDGAPKFTSLPYKLDDFDNPLIHVTNTFQQKNHPDYNTFTLKWTYPELESYLVHDLQCAQPNYIEDQLKPQIKNALAHVVRATRHLLTKRPSQGLFFGVYGADFILDDTLHLYLTEIQKGPGLSHSEEIKKQIIPPMLREAIQIVLEIQTRKRNNQPLANLKSVRGFEPVHL